MTDLQALCERNLDLLALAGIAYCEYVHEPILSRAAAARVRERFGLTGVETKNFFLRVKGRGYGMLITREGKPVDPAALGRELGAKVTPATHDELVEKTGCVPNCAVPFGHRSEIVLVVDRELLRQERLTFSPGPPERTIEVDGLSFAVVLAVVENRVIFI